MKKLLLLAAVAAGIGYLVKFKSEQVKTAAAKVTRDPRVQSALATASESLTPPAVPEEAAEVAERDPVSAPEFAGSDFTASEPPKVDAADIEPLPDAAPEVAPEAAPEAGAAPDPLTDPIETLQDADEGPEK